MVPPERQGWTWYRQGGIGGTASNRRTVEEFGGTKKGYEKPKKKIF
jgi:hypothetical protein